MRLATVTFRRSQLLGVGSFADSQKHFVEKSVYSMFGNVHVTLHFWCVCCVILTGCYITEYFAEKHSVI